jgi:hypothetical protein
LAARTLDSAWAGAGRAAGVALELTRHDAGELASGEHRSWSGTVQAVQELACWRAGARRAARLRRRSAGAQALGGRRTGGGLEQARRRRAG